MNKVMRIIMGHSSAMHELGHMIIRIGVGIVLIVFGFGKLFSGSENVIKIGSAMAAFGIVRGYIIWGYLAAFTEILGGLAYIIGFCTRLVSVSLIWLFIVAIRFHMDKGDPFNVWGFACVLLIISVAFLLSGSGAYSVDHFVLEEESKSRYEL